MNNTHSDKISNFATHNESSNPQKIMQEKYYQKYNLPLKITQNTIILRPSKHKINYSEIFQSSVSLRKTVNQSLGYQCEKPLKLNHQRNKTDDIDIFQKSSQPTKRNSGRKISNKSLCHTSKTINNRSSKEKTGKLQQKKYNGKENASIVNEIDCYSINNLVKEKLTHNKLSKNTLKMKTQQPILPQNECQNLKAMLNELSESNRLLEQQIANRSTEEALFIKNGQKTARLSLQLLSRIQSITFNQNVRNNITDQNELSVLDEIMKVYQAYTLNLFKLLKVREQIQITKEEQQKVKKLKDQQKILEKIKILEEKNLKMTNLLNKMKQKGINVDSFWN